MPAGLMATITAVLELALKIWSYAERKALEDKTKVPADIVKETSQTFEKLMGADDDESKAKAAKSLSDLFNFRV